MKTPTTPTNLKGRKDRKVVLVDFYWTRDKDPRVPLGHASILTALHEVPGLDVASIVIAVNDGRHQPEHIVAKIIQETAGLSSTEVDIAFGAYVWGEELLQNVLRGLRLAGFRGRIILGGPQISYSDAGLEEIYPHADIFIRGYGEQALARIAADPNLTEFPGIHWAGTPDLNLQARIDLNQLPSPWLSGTIPLMNQQFIRWETQRGCPFRCSFCQHREAGARLPRRDLNLPRIEAEIDLFCESGVTDIAVLDPIFNAGEHAIGVLQRFKERGYKGRLSLQCRAEMTSQEFLDAAAELDVCLEFGLQTIHKSEGKAIKRNNHVPSVDKVLEGVRTRGIRHEVSLIFGLPLQSLQSFEKSVQWCLDRNVQVLKAFPLLLLRGTALEADRAKWNLEVSDDEMAMVLSSNSFTVEEWWAMAQLSEALKATEGNHPAFAILKEMAAKMEPSICRWTPDSIKEAV